MAKSPQKPACPSDLGGLIDRLAEVYEMAKAAGDYRSMLRTTQTMARLQDRTGPSRPEGPSQSDLHNLQLRKETP